MHQEAKEGLEQEFLNAEVCANCIVEVKCTCLDYKILALSEKDGEEGLY